MKGRRKRCAIIGAGAAGLSATRWALAYDVEPVVFERSNSIGGLWNYKLDEFSVMESSVTNTSKEMGAFSDFPPHKRHSVYFHNRELMEYFDEYATHHKLYLHIRFGQNVTEVCRAPSYSENGQWNVFYMNLSSETVICETFDAVLLCYGANTSPSFDGVEKNNHKNFGGRILHAVQYKNWRGFEGSTNVVVGAGNTACDIAAELSRVAKKVFLSTRSGSWIFGRTVLYGRPLDVAFITRFSKYVLQRIFPLSLMERKIQKQLTMNFDHEKYGLKPKNGVFGGTITINDELPHRILNGTVVVKPDFREYTVNGVIWADGAISEKIDNIIFATGYNFNANLVENGELVECRDNFAALYLNVFPPGLADHNTLGFVCVHKINGPSFPAMEMQARLFFAQLSYTIGMPAADVMLADIQRKKHTATKNPTPNLDYVHHMDELAAAIGCLPNTWRLAFTDPRLALSIVFDCHLPYFYRLTGPHAWSGARRAILDVHSRMDYPLNGTRLNITPHLPGKRFSLIKINMFYIFVAFALFAGVVHKLYFS